MNEVKISPATKFTSSSVQLAVNEKNLVKNLKFAFANFSTFLAELVQNSRRAGATAVNITLEGDTLIVVDDGCGIEDFQNLFTIAESGWDNQTQSLENPFGMGFTSALFACERLTVESRGKRLQACTADILNMSTQKVERGTVICGTRLTLKTLTFDPNKIAYALERIAYGYPIPIRFNGKELARGDAIDMGTFVQSPIGSIQIRSLQMADVNTSVGVYLQGNLVLGNKYDWRSLNIVVHLDSTKFQAKLPDRDTLIDAAVREQEIKQAITAVIHAQLVKMQKTLDPAAFVDTYWAVATKYAPDLLRDCPVVPDRLFDTIDSLVMFSDSYDWAEYRSKGKTVSRADVEQGNVRVVRGSGYVDLDSDSLSAVKHAYARGMEALVIEAALPAGHWLLNAPSFDDLEVSYEVINPGAVAGTDFLAYEFEIKICDAIRISGTWGDLQIDDSEICVRLDGESEFITLLSPKSVEWEGSGVEQFESFCDEHTFDEDNHDESISRFARWIMQARNSSPVDLLNDLLRSTFVDTKSTRGLRFVVEVSEHGYLKVVEQLAPEAAHPEADQGDAENSIQS